MRLVTALAVVARGRQKPESRRIGKVIPLLPKRDRQFVARGGCVQESAVPYVRVAARGTQVEGVIAGLGGVSLRIIAVTRGTLERRYARCNAIFAVHADGK